MGKYSQVIQDVQDENGKRAARAAGLTAPKVEPDAMGRAMAVADARGLPPGVVAEHLADYDERDRLDALEGAAGESPALAHWLGNPDHAAVAKDDVGVLGAIGGMFNRGLLSAAKIAPWMPLPQSALDLQREREEAKATGPVMRPVQPSWFSELTGKFQSGWFSGQAGTSTTGLPSLSSARATAQEEFVAKGLGYASAEDYEAAQLGVYVGDRQRRAEAANVETAATAEGFAEIAKAEAAGDTWGIIKAAATNPRAVMSVVVQSLGTAAPQLAMSAAMPASRIVQGITGGAGSFTTEHGMTVLDVMTDAGVDTTNAQQVTAFLRNKPAMAAARRKATQRGVAVGTFDALTAGFAGRLLANSRRSIASVGSRVIGEGLVQAGGGAAGEATAQLASEGKITSQSDIILEAAAEVPTFLAEGRGQLAEARRAALNNADKFDAQGEQRSVTRLVELAAQSKTKQRAGTRFESLIQSMAGEGEDTVYMPPEAVRTLFQSAALDDSSMAAFVDEGTLREAFATGSEVAIPLAKYARMVTPEQHAAIADVVRLQPGTRHDLPNIDPEEIQQAIADGMAEARQNDKRENGPAGQVFDDVYGQLLAKQDEALARQNASVVQSVYRNLAERTGTDAWTLYQQFRINIPGSRSDARGAPRGVDVDIDPLLDALRSGKLPTDREIYGDTLVSALHAAGGLREGGGELANMDAAKQRPGLVNNLAGMTLDDAVMWAYQEGFIATPPTNMQEGAFDNDAPDINTLLDMLGADLGGTPQYRVNGQNDARFKFREDAQSLADELDQRGIDLSKMDNAAVRAALGQRRALYQSALPNEATSLDEAREAAAAFVGQPIENINGLPAATVSNTTLGKMLSGKAVAKSTSLQDHARAVANLDTLYRMGMLDVTHADNKGEPTIAAIHRVVAPMVGANGEVLAVKMTVKETTGANQPNPLYTVETLEIGNPPSVLSHADPDGTGISPQAGFAPDVTRMLDEFKREHESLADSGDQTRPPEFVDDDEGDMPGAKYAEWDDDAHIRFGQSQNGEIIVQSMSSSQEVRGREMLRWLNAEYGRPVVAVEVTQEAMGFWEKMRNEGLVSDWSVEQFESETVPVTRNNEANILHQSGAKAARGSVSFREESGARVFDIELLAGMDASTFMHEMGHVYLEVLNDLAAREGAPKQVTDDVATLNAWLGRDAGAAISTDQHEQFARGFEAYLREGNAPSSALRRAFAAFKVWLTAIYRSARGLNVELTDDVRAVMDRIVASDAEIAEARETQYHEALITDALAVGMSPAEFEAYNAAVARAREDAEAVTAAEVLGALQREQKTWYMQEKRKVREEVTAEMRDIPAYRAMRLLRTGKLPNGELAPDVLRVKLSKDDLLDQYGQSFLRNLSGMYALDGGVRADEAAHLLGFGSGRELVDAMVNAPKFAEAVAAETNRRMQDRHPDPMTDGTLPDRAMVAAHRDRQADVMLREIRALETHVSGRAQAQGAIIKGIASTIISEKKLRHLQPATYRAAEARAGREAFEAAAKQDWPTALAARRRQLLNFELFREAVRVRDESARAAKYLAKFSETKTRARLGKAGGDYLDQVDGLLDRFDFRKISDKAADRRARLADWIQAQAERGIDVNLPDKLLDEAFRTPFREMTVADLRAVRDAVKAIDHLARLKGKLLLAGELRDAAEIDTAMAASLRAAHQEKFNGHGLPPKSIELIKLFREGRVLQATATDLARELDGFKEGGAIWQNTVGVMRNTMNNEVNPRLQQAQADLAGIYLKHYTKADIRKFGDRFPVPELGLWNKSRLLALALNWGNEGNREAILTQARARLTAEQAAALLGRLDARDWAFVQDVWALVDAQWPAIAEAQKRRTGLVPERVKPSAFTVQTRDGQTITIPGGYYPLKYEADSVKSMKDEADDFYNSIRTGRTAKASTKNGHTVERVGSGGRTVRLDTGVIQQHLRDVIRDVYLGDAVNYVHNVLNGAEFREAVDATGLPEYRQAMEVWLKDVAAGEIGPRRRFERIMRGVRQNFTASVLTMKPVSALLQVTGLLQSTVVLGQSHMLHGVQQLTNRPRAMYRYVRQASPYMDSRVQSHIEAVQTVMDAEAGRFQAGKAAMIRWGYWMIGRVQSMVDMTTWLAAEHKGMELFNNDVAKARQYADDVVSRAQGSGEFIDKSPLQRGTWNDGTRQQEFIKAMTALMGYMIAKGNVAYETTRKANLRSPRQAMKWAADMVMLFAVEGLIVAAIRGQLPGDDDDDGLADDLAAFVAKDASSTLFGVVPGLGAAVSEFRGYSPRGAVQQAWHAYAQAVQQARQGEWDDGARRAAINTLGVTFGFPSAQANKTWDAVSAKADGSDVSPYEYLTGPKKQ